jgi:fructokinase
LKTNSKRILSCGEVLWDLFPEGPRFGGAPANFACHAAILGAEVTMLSAVGDDARGKEAISILQGFGIDTSLLQQVADAPTGSVGVSVDGSRKPSFEIHAGSAWDSIGWTTALKERVAEVDALYFGTLGQRGEVSRGTIRQALSLAKASNVLRVLDVNLRKPFYDAALIRESIGQANVLKLSDDELGDVASACGFPIEAKPETTLLALLTRFELHQVVMTRGAEGALLVSAEGVLEQPGIPTQVVDTVGAGDSFTAAFVLGLLQGEDYSTILRRACELASTICSQSGAVPHLAHSNL